MVIICDIIQSNEKQITNEFTDIVSVHRLSGYDLCDRKDLGISDLFYFFSWNKECIHQCIENLGFNELVHSHSC